MVVEQALSVDVFPPLPWVLRALELQAEAFQKQQAFCSVPGRQRLPSDLTRNLIPPLDNFLCLVIPAARAAVASETRLGFQSLGYAVIIPLFYRLSQLAISPNFSNFVFVGGVLPLVSIFLTPVLGPGVVAAGIIVPLYTLGMALQLRNKIADVNPLPVTPSAIYSVNICTLSLVFLIFLVYSLDPTWATDSGRSNWLAAAILFSLWPLYTGFTVSRAAFSRNAPADEQQARAMIREVDADTISYGFERIWGYYRRLALVGLGLWYFGLIRMYMLLSDLHSQTSMFESLRSGQFYSVIRSGKARITGKQVIGQEEYSMALNVAALIFSAFVILLIERLSIRSVSVPSSSIPAKRGAKAGGASAPAEPEAEAAGVAIHPLTGAPRSALDTECQRAIAGAPAGLPAAEIGWGILASCLLGGPGFGLLLWWSRGEEEMGWKARRAWRQVVAVEGKE
ncbi:hypothetical protein K437DRAFT_255590 [Tilletiaria anomala UBC 951]|uniref:Uncharacterized protein n=1 Tax=Tilletiaria anomala (strain ATCC 24038 / CBS 436.72 / UBC 951) TaxID=1037660 RepID=A0A066W3F1_TILAU|nr:uncharacterized protein K437DRAFT_255590 [Tilletiaria anomala UBC 951]KDN48482.1 hypothetical protein K437DRAFT_255590 [Tilletiaria anomala UBC 951]